MAKPETLTDEKALLTFKLIRAEKLAAPLEVGSMGLPFLCPKCQGQREISGTTYTTIGVRWRGDVLAITCTARDCGFAIVVQRN